MLLSIILLLLGLVMILVAAEGFTNGIEAIGHKFSLSRAVVGSILAAVGTALPETILPIFAILFSPHGSASEIGVGAILGAPFMLSTLAFFLVGITATFLFWRKRRGFEVRVELSSTRRDLAFFIGLYALALFAPMTGMLPNAVLAGILILGYGVYVFLTVRCCDSGKMENFEYLHFFNIQRLLGLVARDPLHPGLIYSQVVISLAVMVAGAHLFVEYLGEISLHLGLNPLLFALVLAPVATELPEKFNSVIWTLKNQDSLAMGNISGAMVFQSTFPVSVGLLYTEWEITGLALFSAAIALVSATAVLVMLLARKSLNPLVLLLGGGLYLVYMAALVWGRG